MKSILLSVAIFIVCISQICAQFSHPGRGMYVNKFFRTAVNSNGNLGVDQNLSILSVTSKEDALLQYAKDNHITYLVLYDLHRVFGEPLFETYLCSFIEKAKTQYCIEKIGVPSSCASMFDNVASAEATPPLVFRENDPPAYREKLGITQKSYKPGDSLFYLSEVVKLSVPLFQNSYSVTNTSSL